MFLKGPCDRCVLQLSPLNKAPPHPSTAMKKCLYKRGEVLSLEEGQFRMKKITAEIEWYDTENIFPCISIWHFCWVLCQKSERLQSMLFCLIRCLTEYLCHKWPLICFTCHKHFPVLSSFMTSHRVCNLSNIGATSGTGTAYPSGTPEFNPRF